MPYNASLVSFGTRSNVLRNGLLSTVTGTNPAANTELSTTVTAGEIWELISYSVACVQGITQTPQPILRIADAAGLVIFEGFGSSGAQAASTTCQYTWMAGAGAPSAQVGATTNVHAVAGLPLGLVLGSAFVISSVTVGIGANTDYGAPQLYVLKYS